MLIIDSIFEPKIVSVPDNGRQAERCVEHKIGDDDKQSNAGNACLECTVVALFNHRLSIPIQFCNALYVLPYQHHYKEGEQETCNQRASETREHQMPHF